MKNNVRLGMAIGQRVWEMATKDGPFSRGAAFDAVVATGCSEADATQIALYAEWYDCGFPRVVVGHKHAASLMCTSLAAGDAPHVVPPWSVFVVDVPDRMIFNADGKEVTALLCFDIREETMRSVSCLALCDDTDARMAMIDIAESVEGLTEANRGQHPSSQLAARLMVGAVAELSAHREAATMGADRSVRRDARGEPTTRTFVVTRPVRVDCRDAVAAYLAGGRATAPSVQVLVRGHWRRQPHGKGGAERRWQQIEPYWRGPEDAPIALRPHALPGE